MLPSREDSEDLAEAADWSGLLGPHNNEQMFLTLSVSSDPYNPENLPELWSQIYSEGRVWKWPRGS